MSKKHPVYVSIPVGHACLSLSALFQMNMEAERVRFENTENLRDIARLQGQIMKTTEQLAEAEKKIEELEDVLKSRTDAMIYWNKEYEKLQKQLQALVDEGAGNAKTKEA